MSNELIDKSSDFSIGNFRVYPSKNLLVDKANEIHVTPKVLAVLTLLAEHESETVSKERIIERVWGGISISDMVLSKAISDLRRALGDSAQNQEYIKTISKKGYSLSKEVKWGSANNEDEIENSSDLNRSREDDYKPLRVFPIFLGIVILLLGYLSYIQLEKSRYDETAEIKNITANSYTQRNPRITKDGSLTAYFVQKPNSPIELIIRTNSTGATKVVKQFETSFYDAEYGGLAFSSNSRFLAVRANSAKDECEIFILELKTLIERKLPFCPPSYIASIDFSPDGKYILTTEFNHENRKVGLIELDIHGNNELSRFKSVGLEGMFLYPRYSDNNKQIASVHLVSKTHNWSLVVTDRSTQESEIVYESERQINQVAWGSEERILYFVIHQGATPGIWKLNIDSGEAIRVHSSPNEISDLDYSRLSGEFVYSNSKKYLSIIRKAKDELGNYRKAPLNLSTSFNMSPNLSPSGEFLAYISRDFGPDRVFIHNLETNESKLAYKGTHGRIIDVSWSGNSRNLGITEVNKAESKILEVDLNDLSVVSLTDNDNVNKYIRWNYNTGERFWLEAVNNNSLLMKLNEERKEELIGSLDEVHNHHFDHDGFLFVSQGAKHAKEIKKVSVNGQGEFNIEPIYSDAAMGAWSVNKNKLYFLQWNKRNTKLFSKTLDGTKLREIDEIDGEVIFLENQLSIASDESQYFVTIEESWGSDLFLITPNK